jgi:hypothetical protein
VLQGVPELLELFDRGQRSALSQLRQKLVPFRELSVHERRLDIAGRIARDLPHHAEQLPEVPELLGLRILELAELDIVRLEHALERVAAGFQRRHGGQGFGEQLRLLGLPGLESLLAREVLGALAAEALSHLEEQRIE